MKWSPGDTVGQRYKLDRLIGEGGMGVVWAAVQLVTRKPVALKALRAAHTGDKQLLQRFLREARAACAVHHPNVVELYDVIVVEDGLPVMVMDLLEGESLGQRVEREHAIPLPELASILLPVVSAVGTAHSIGIVHRDLKPDNIFLSRTATGTEVKVLDFGIAKLTATDGDAAATGGLTGTGAMLGTPFYMAPEQIYGEKDVDHRTDIWAIGVILYECLAGVRPTQADSIGQILKVITRDGIKPLREICPDLPPDILDLVDRMLSVDRANRPSSLTEVGQVLAAHANGPAFGDTRMRTSNPSGKILSASNPSGKSPLANTPAPNTPSVEQMGEAATLAAPAPATLSSTTTTVGDPSTPAPRRATFAVVGLVAVAAVGAAVFFGVRSLGPPADASLASPASSVRADPASSVAASAAPATPTASDRAPVASSTPTPSASTSATGHHPDAIRKPIASATAPQPSVSASPTAHSPGGVVDKPPF